jgi:GTPase SAR1 family protein
MTQPALPVCFGQIVVGAPGVGKSAYCAGMSGMLAALKRPCAVVNLDPANDALPYECAVDVRELIQVEDAMTAHSLGPNGALLFCVEFIEKNIAWLFDRLRPHLARHAYVLIDCPGQVELYTVHDSMRRITAALVKHGLRLCAVHLVDSMQCKQGTAFVAAVLLSLSTTLQLELPHVNVLSKIDLLPKYGELDFNLEFYTDVLDLRRLHEFDSNDRLRRLNAALADLVDEFSLVSFQPLDIADKESVLKLLRVCDKTVGFIASAADGSEAASIAYSVAVAGPEFAYERALGVYEEKAYAEQQQFDDEVDPNVRHFGDDDDERF